MNIIILFVLLLTHDTFTAPPVGDIYNDCSLLNGCTVIIEDNFNGPVTDS